MAAVSGVHVLLWLLLWGALIRTYELHFHDSNNVLGSIARALTVIY